MSLAHLQNVLDEVLDIDITDLTVWFAAARESYYDRCTTCVQAGEDEPALAWAAAAADVEAALARLGRDFR
jgi:hypothetical protein